MGKRQKFSLERTSHGRQGMTICAIMLPMVFIMYVLFAVWQPGFFDNILANLKSGILLHAVF
jgi:hypothetical protein